MANEGNLIKNEDLTPEQRRENASKAGKASAKKRKEQKTMREQMKLLLSLPYDADKEFKAKLKEIGIPDEDIDNKMAVVVSIWRKALRGDLQAVSMLLEMIEESTPKEVNVNHNVGASFMEALNNSAKEVWRKDENTEEG